MADRVSYCFAGGETQLVPGAYIEFAERLVLPQFAGFKVWRSRHACLLPLADVPGGSCPGQALGRMLLAGAWAGWCGTAAGAPTCLLTYPAAPLPRPQPEEIQEQHRRDGFETASADKIFESTTLAACQDGQ